MRKAKQKISFDKESNMLSIELSGGKSADSDISGNLVIDYDKNGKVIRINLYHFDFERFRESRKALDAFQGRSRAAVAVR